MEPNLDDLMNSLADFREVIATTEQGLKELKQKKNDLEAQLIAKIVSNAEVVNYRYAKYPWVSFS